MSKTGKHFNFFCTQFRSSPMVSNWLRFVEQFYVIFRKFCEISVNMWTWSNMPCHSITYLQQASIIPYGTKTFCRKLAHHVKEFNFHQFETKSSLLRKAYENWPRVSRAKNTISIIYLFLHLSEFIFSILFCLWWCNTLCTYVKIVSSFQLSILGKMVVLGTFGINWISHLYRFYLHVPDI